jgi:hypothetical protein
MTISNLDTAAWDVVRAQGHHASESIRFLQDKLDLYTRVGTKLIAVEHVRKQLIDSRIGDVLYALRVINMTRAAQSVSERDLVIEMEAE